MADTLGDVVVYKTKRQSLKMILGMPLFAALCISMLCSGFTEYALASNDQPFLQMKAVKHIFFGSLGSLIFGLASLSIMVQKLSGKPRLTLSAKHLVIDGLRGARSADWSNLNAFDIIPPAHKGKPVFFRSTYKQPHMNRKGKPVLSFVVPATSFAIAPYALFDELNIRQARAAGEDYTAQAPIHEALYAQIQKPMNTRRQWILWNVFVMLGLLFLSIVAEVVFHIPKHPYEKDAALGSLVAGIVVATLIVRYKTRKT